MSSAGEQKAVSRRIAVPSIEDVDQAKESDKPLSRFRRNATTVPTPVIEEPEQAASGSSTPSADGIGASSPVAFASSRTTVAPSTVTEEERSNNATTASTTSVPLQKDDSVNSVAGPSNYTSVTGPSRSGSGVRPGTLIINRRRQDGNPVVKYIRNVPYEWGDTKADFDLGSGACCLYLSLKWHKLHPGYIETRFKEIGHSYALQVVLAVVNVEEPRHILRELNMYCFRAGWTLILAHSVEEAAEYLESFKVTERRVGEIVSDAAKKVTKPPPKTVVDLTVDKDKKAMCDAAVNLLASIRSVSRTDAQRLIGTFGSVRNIAEASVDQLSLCPGLGEQKAKRLHDTLRDSFIVNAPKKSGRSKLSDVVVQ